MTEAEKKTLEVRKQILEQAEKRVKGEKVEGYHIPDGYEDEDGKIDFTGKKPINPSGGLIGAGHPVGASGVRMALDLTKQVTGQAGDYQVDGAKNGIMLNIGGSATTNMTFVIGKGE